MADRPFGYTDQNNQTTRVVTSAQPHWTNPELQVQESTLYPYGWGTSWLHPAGIPGLVGAPMGYRGAGTARVVVRGVDNHVHEISLTPYGWSHFDMHPAGTPDTAGDPMGYQGGGTARVVFRGVDNHVHEIGLGPNGWDHFDMHPAGTPDAAGDPMGYQGGGTARVVFRGTDNHVHEIGLGPNGWDHFDMHPAGTPDAAGDPMGYQGGGTARVVFRGADNHVHEIWLGPNGWDHFAMHPAGTPDTVGDPWGFQGANTARVTFRSADNHIHLLSLDAPSGSGWTQVDLTATVPGAAPASSDPMGFESNGRARIVFVGYENTIHELSTADGVSWAHEVISDPPPPAPAVIVTSSQVTDHSIALQWQQPPVGVQDGLFHLGWSTSGNGPDAWDMQQVAGLSATVDQLIAGTEYFVWVWYTDQWGRLSLRTQWQVDRTTTGQAPPPPPPTVTTVPQLIGLHPNYIEIKLRETILDWGTVNWNAPPLTDSALIVCTAQDPVAGAVVPTHTKVNLTGKYQATPVSGFASIEVTNQNTDGRWVGLYLIDMQTPGVSTHVGDLDFGKTTSVKLSTDKHRYRLVAVDHGLSGCPANGNEWTINCQRLVTSDLVADTKGIVYPVYIS